MKHKGIIRRLPLMVALCMVVAMLPLPTAAAEGIALCDIAIAPTKCAASIAVAGSACANASFDGPFFPEVNARSCIDVAGAASAAGSINIGASTVVSNAYVGSAQDPCTRTSTPLLGTIVCSSSKMQAGSAQDCLRAKAYSGATNGLGPIATGIVKAQSCQINVLRILANVNGPQETRPLGEFPPEAQAALRAAVLDVLLDELDLQSALWPDEPLYNALRQALRVEFEDQAASLSPDTEVAVS